MSLKFIILTLNEPSRRDNVNQLVSILPRIRTERHPATGEPPQLFTGIKGTDLWSVSYTYNPHRRLNGQLMSSNEIACALGHLGIYQQLLDDPDHDMYCVLEDDATLVCSSQEFYEALKDIPPMDSWNIIHMADCEWYSLQRTTLVEPSAHFCNIEKRMFNRATAYIINKAGARTLIMYSGGNGVVAKPADDLLSNGFMEGVVKVIASTKYFFRERDENISLINSEPPS